MDNNNIVKLRNRQNINEDNKNVQDKLSKLSSDAIKLKVAQDAINWDLRQKLQQIEGNHERLQQNMVDLQMQYETVSGQYQEELRKRPEILNKLSSTREICDVLEDYSLRLKQTLSRCKADQKSLCEAYQSSGQLVQDLKTSYQQVQERDRQTIARLQEMVKLREEHQASLMDLFNSSKQQLDGELSKTHEQLTASHAAKAELQISLNEQVNKLAYANSQLEKKEEDITTLKREMTKMVNEFNSEIEGARITLDSHEKNLKKANEDIMNLKKALHNQEDFCKSISEEKNMLEEKVAVLEEDKMSAFEEIEKLKNDLEVSYASHDLSKKEISNLNEKTEKMRNELGEMEEIVNQFKVVVERLKDQIKGLEDDKNSLTESLGKKGEENSYQSTRVQDLITQVATLQLNVEDTRKEYDNDRKSTDLIIKELNETIICQKEELEKKASTATKLMTELQNSNDAINKIRSALQKCRKEMDDDKEHFKETQVKMGVRIEHLEGKLKDSEKDASMKMNLIQELKQDKERLLSKMSEMEETIANARDQLSAPNRPRPFLQAESDNAVTMPTLQESREKSPVLTPRAMLPPPERTQKRDNHSVFSNFSDSSADDNTIDSDLVNRCFEAMSNGQRLPPQPLSALKRRRTGPASVARDSEMMRCPPAQQFSNKKFFKSQRRCEVKPKAK
ncbi:synaptonemal complex protein 1-like [Pieris brassicae]|uniref:synaptonemal complex protein 1-like n=1 Tax=Pieris brassicae TaxID=7116 RepID=UPI001E66053B|nr:synaptonemal complex protein 1-like [Pieris brassicae]